MMVVPSRETYIGPCKCFTSTAAVRSWASLCWRWLSYWSPLGLWYQLLRPSHPVHCHFKGIKEEDGAQEVAIRFPSSDDAEESTVARYNGTVAELAHLYHCLKTQSFPPPSFHLSQLTQLPFEWPVAGRVSTSLGRLQLRPKCISSGSRTNSQWATTY